MKVILIKAVKGIGQAGDIKDVSDGHARNYLIPRGLAMPESARAATALKQKREGAASKEKQLQMRGRRDARKVRRLELVFDEPTSSSGRLYSAVTGERIAEVIAKQSNIKVAGVELPQPIKRPGKYHVKVNVTKDKSTEVRVLVRAKE